MHRGIVSPILRLGGAAAIAIGSFLPWVAAIRDPWIFSGTELPVSVFFGRPFISDPPWLSPDPASFGSAGALLILVSLIGTSMSWRWPMAAFGLAAAALSASALVVMTIDREPEYAFPQAAGSGLSVVLVGGGACLAGGILALAESRRESTPFSRARPEIHP